MAEQERKKPQRKQPRRSEEEREASPEVQSKGEALKEDMDRLLDEIDSVLEENAEEFIKNYVQKGGE